MDLTGVELVPAEGMVAVKFVDEEDDADEAMPGIEEPSDPYEGVLAIVVAVGKKVDAKKGDTVVMRSWARSGTKLGDNLYICSGFDIVATI